MNRMKASFVSGLLVVSMMLFMAGAAMAADVTLKFAGQHPEGHPATNLMNDIAKEVAEKTDGKVEIKVYPAGQLGDYTLVYEELIRGTIDMSCTSVPSQFDPRLELVYVNGYVKGYDDVAKVFAPNGWMFNTMDKLNKRLGVKLLGFFVEGMIGTGTTKPVESPLDPSVPKDHLIRVANMDVYKLGAEAMGYRAVTIPWSDVYQSLQTGVADGANGFSCSAAYTMLRDVIKYWYMTNYSLEIMNYMISEQTWSKLSPEHQKVLQEAVDHAAAKSIQQAKSEDERYMQMMRDHGIQVFTYEEAELLPLSEACATTWTKLEKNMTKELMDEFRKELAPK